MTFIILLINDLCFIRFVSFPETVKMESKIPFRVKMEILNKSGLIFDNKLPTRIGSSPNDCTVQCDAKGGCCTSATPAHSSTSRKEFEKCPGNSTGQSLSTWKRNLNPAETYDCHEDFCHFNSCQTNSTPKKTKLSNEDAVSKCKSLQLCLGPSLVLPGILPQSTLGYACPLQNPSAKSSINPLQFWSSFIPPANPRFTKFPMTTNKSPFFQFPRESFGFNFHQPYSPSLTAFSPYLLSPTKSISVLR